MADRLTELAQSGWIAEHRDQYLNDGEAGHLWDSTVGGGPGPLPTLLLFTVGRKSGKESVMPLLYGEVPGGYAVIASRGGDSKHPGWFHNLCARETVKVKVVNDMFEAIARIAQGDERTAVWDQMVAMYPPYANYAVKAAPREIPVVILTRCS
jgi:deazaflavin-dependent oxidoreductase (nitroreductase family)